MRSKLTAAGFDQRKQKKKLKYRTFFSVALIMFSLHGHQNVLGKNMGTVMLPGD